MAMSNRDRVHTALDLLAEGLFPFVDAVMTDAFNTSDWDSAWASDDDQRKGGHQRTYVKHDLQLMLRAVTEQGYHFKDHLSRAQQGFASELREVRNKFAHSNPFSSDDTLRALDTTQRLLEAVGGVEQAEKVQKLRSDLQRTVYEDQTRQKTKNSTKVQLDPGKGLKPWREVIQPHTDVTRGDFTASEFAANLHVVHSGQAKSPEYYDPVEFFNRTYLTEGLHDLLTRGLKRLSGDMNASPVVNLQTNFGGGKTHSMLALYHLFSGTPASAFTQEVQELVAAADVHDLESLDVTRVALVGTQMQAEVPLDKDDGTKVHTIWGELAWQLGGRAAFDQIADADATGTNPGDALRVVIEQHSPCLILIDEWVAYARQLVTTQELRAGSFDTQFTFAQSLTEIVSAIPGAMLVVSIPASDAGEVGSGGADIEIGGANGQMALNRLQNVIRRVADQWRPSTKDESFEIVRRRIFQAPDADGLATIAATARHFVNMYRDNAELFPRDASTLDDTYEMRLRASYPLHPELLDRLYEDWSTLERFQRTRGVLNLVASIVHVLWASNDTSPLILPGNVPLDSAKVSANLTQYLEDQWKPIIDSDIDGSGSTAQRIDNEKSTLGARFVTQRLARTIFVGAAPRVKSARKGLDKQYVWLGTAMPGDALGNFGMAIDLLAERSTYFYEEQGHFWFDTQPSVTKTANDYAERLREDVELVWNEIVRRLQHEEKTPGRFDRVHVAPASTADIPDLEETRLVIVHPRWARRKQDSAESDTYAWIRSALETKGSSQRVHRNTLIFVVADQGELETLEAATRHYLAWMKVREQSESLNLSMQQQKQTELQVERHDQTVQDRVQSTFIWALHPQQFDPTKPFDIAAEKIGSSGTQSIAERVETRLIREELLVTQLAPQILGATLHQELRNRWEATGEISIGELWSYFTQFPYMQRLVRRDVLDQAVIGAIDAIASEHERFAIAVDKDVNTGRYIGLIVPPVHSKSLQVTDKTLLVDYERARAQLEEDLGATADTNETEAAPGSHIQDTDDDGEVVATPGVGGLPVDVADPPAGGSQAITRFFGSVDVNSSLYARDFGVIAKEVIERLIAAGADVRITIDIDASAPNGFEASDMRTISENAATLKFNQAGFEES